MSWPIWFVLRCSCPWLFHAKPFTTSWNSDAPPPPPLQWFTSICAQSSNHSFCFPSLIPELIKHCLYELITLLFHARTVEVTKGERALKESDTALNSTKKHCRLTLFNDSWDALRLFEAVRACSDELYWVASVHYLLLRMTHPLPTHFTWMKNTGSQDVVFVRVF